jgi:hypothetical protein
LTPLSRHEHDVPSLDQVTRNAVDVVPLVGLSDAEHVGGAATLTVFELQLVVPPGPVAVSVILCVPAARVPSDTFEPEHAIEPWSTPSSAHEHDVPLLDHVP